jgi:ubiquinone/menaquinone biosynthesis C-methylase UbiE
MVIQAAELTVALEVSSWLRQILVDPVSKKPFVEQSESTFHAPCGISYTLKAGVPDFRVGMVRVARSWEEGQEEYEKFHEKYLNLGEADTHLYQEEQRRDAPMYEKLELLGRVLDVGGGLGHIRKYMQPGQEFVSIDPSVGIHERARNRRNLFAAYPLSTPLNLVWGFAEMLPFQDQSFDTVNMRSCIDHFSNPEQALLEAYRVLKPQGRLTIGMTVKSQTVKGRFKDTARDVRGLLLPQFRDHHIWHPTYLELVALCQGFGFSLLQEVWQTDEVVYASFVRQPTVTIAV